MRFIKDNLPIAIISLVTVAVFVGIAFLAGRSETTNEKAPTVDPNIFINPQAHVRGKTSVLSESTTSADPSTFVATLVEFSDFQCPACGAFYPLVKQLEEEFKGKLKVVYKHYPLPQHQYALKAAEASEAAGAQGKFWEYHDLLFENQNDLSVGNLKKLANDLGLNIEQFNNDLDSGKYASTVSEDIKLGNKLNVNSTPTFYLNGKKLILRNADDLKKEIQAVVNSK